MAPFCLCFGIIGRMYRTRGKTKGRMGRPALVCVATDQTIVINGKTYTVIKMFYDLKGQYLPHATLQP